MANKLNIAAFIGSVVGIITIIFWREVYGIAWNIVAVLLWGQVLCLRLTAEKGERK